MVEIEPVESPLEYDEPDGLDEVLAGAREDEEASVMGGCPVLMGNLDPCCGRALHVAPPSVDRFPVCLMHSKDPAKRDSELDEKFQREIDAILDAAVDDDAYFTEFVFFKCLYRGRDFRSYCYFTNAMFLGEIDFTNANFMPYTSFDKATFGKDARFDEARFGEATRFAHATFGTDASFQKATFGGSADFSNAEFAENSKFEYAKFGEKASFNRATFGDGADFHYATFAENADFIFANLGKNSSFTYATFGAEAKFNKATFDNVHFGYAAFGQGAGFPGAMFGENAKLWEAKFGKGISFQEATFGENARLDGATFDGNADFGKARFGGQAQFKKTSFAGITLFTQAKFLDSAEFRETVFTQRESKLPSAVFSQAVFYEPEKVTFYKVNLSHALFHDCDVTKVNFSSVWWSWRKGARKRMVFEELVDLDKAEALRLREDGVDERDYRLIAELYQRLKKNYDERKDYWTAGNFHYGEMEMKRLATPSPGPLSRLLAWLSFGRMNFGANTFNPLRRWWHRHLSLVALYRYASHYGESYRLALLWMVVTLVGFGVVFPAVGLKYVPDQDFAAAKGAQPYVLTYWHAVPNGGADPGWWKADVGLLLDGALTSVEVAAFQKDRMFEPAYRLGRVLSLGEMLLISTLFGLFLLAIRRQFRR